MSLRKSLLISLAQRYSAFVVGFAASMVLARLLTPEEFGVYSVAMAAVGLVGVLRDFGVNRYLIQEKDLTEARLRTAFGLMLATSWGLGALLYAASGTIADFYGEPDLAEVLDLICIAFVVMPFGSAAHALLSREMRFGALYLIAVPPAVAGAAASVGLALAGWSHMSLAWGAVLSSLLTSLAALAWRRDVARLTPSLAEWRRVLSFGGWATAASALGQMAVRAPDLVVGRMLGLGAAGLYGKAVGIADVFQLQVMSAVDPVALTAVARAVRSGQEVRPPYLRAVACVTGLGWPFYAFVVLMAFPIVRLLFGPQWDDIVPLVQLLCLSRMVRLLVPITGPVLTGYGRVRRLFAVEVAVQAVSLPLLVAGALHGLVAVAALRLVSAVVLVALHQRALSGLIGVSGGDTLRMALPALPVTALAMAGPTVVALIYGLRPEEILLPLVLGALSWGAGWLAGILVMRHPLADEVHAAAARLRRSPGWRPLPDSPP